jgi:rod shape-determining protein MreD
MKSLLGYLAAGLGFLFVQCAVFPRIFSWDLKPDLLLILVVLTSFRENWLRAGIICYLLGLLLDTFAGESLGLYGLVFLAISLAIKSASGWLNNESPLLLLFMVACGTVLEAAILIFSLGFFANAGPSWRLIAGSLPFQTLLNLAAAGLLLWFASLLPRRGRSGGFSFDSSL